MYARAAGVVALRIQGDRVAGTGDTPDPFVVYVDSITSTAGTVDLRLEELLRDTGPSDTGKVNVRVYDLAAGSPRIGEAADPAYDCAVVPINGSVRIYCADHDRHFLPDEGTLQPHDPAVYVASS